MSSSQPHILLTLEGVRALEDRERELTRAITEATEEREVVRRRLAAAREFMPQEGTFSAIPMQPALVVAEAALTGGNVRAFLRPKPASRRSRKSRRKKTTRGSAQTWPSTILQILKSADKGLAHAGIMSELMKTDFVKKVKWTDRRYYTAIARLRKKGHVEQHGSLFYLPEVAARLAKEGPLPTKDLMQPARHSNRVATPDIVRRILLEHREGLIGGDIMGRVCAAEDAPESVQKFPHFVYTTLGNMIRRGDVIKDGRLYRLAPQQEDGPATAAAGPS